MFLHKILPFVLVVEALAECQGLKCANVVQTNSLLQHVAEKTLVLADENEEKNTHLFGLQPAPACIKKEVEEMFPVKPSNPTADDCLKLLGLDTSKCDPKIKRRIALFIEGGCGLNEGKDGRKEGKGKNKKEDSAGALGSGSAEKPFVLADETEEKGAHLFEQDEDDDADIDDAGDDDAVDDDANENANEDQPEDWPAEDSHQENDKPGPGERTGNPIASLIPRRRGHNGYFFDAWSGSGWTFDLCWCDNQCRGRRGKKWCWLNSQFIHVCSDATYHKHYKKWKSFKGCRH